MQTQIEQIVQSIKNLPLEDLDRLQQVISEEKLKKREKEGELKADVERWQKTDKWLAENRHNYIGQWVCLYGDQLIAHGADALEVDAKAREFGIKAPLLEHIVEELPWGGW